MGTGNRGPTLGPSLHKQTQIEILENQVVRRPHLPAAPDCDPQWLPFPLRCLIQINTANDRFCSNQSFSICTVSFSFPPDTTLRVRLERLKCSTRSTNAAEYRLSRGPTRLCLAAICLLASTEQFISCYRTLSSNDCKTVYLWRQWHAKSSSSSSIPSDLTQRLPPHPYQAARSYTLMRTLVAFSTQTGSDRSPVWVFHHIVSKHLQTELQEAAKQ